MWTREQIKTKAKGVLRTTYWSSLLVSFLIFITGGGNHGGGSSSGGSSWTQSGGKLGYEFAAFIAMVVFVLAVIGIMIRIFVGYALEVGGRKFFLNASDTGKAELGDLGYGFKNAYGNIVKTLFFRAVFIFLWTLLLIIPGIIKFYAYRMVPYILADNPDMDSMRAIEISKKMTNGHKFDIFVLDLSFIGWYILGLLALGIGTFFVRPYEDATNAELYKILRQEALELEYCSHEELGLTL